MTIKHMLTIWMLALFISVSFAQSQPQLTMSNDRVDYGEIMTITGSGFASDTAISIALGVENVGAGDALMEVQTDNDGAFATELLIPATWMNGVPILEETLVAVACDVGCTQSATTTFQYNPPTLTELGWVEVYNETFDFSLLAPADWLVIAYDNGFDLIPVDEEIVAITARAVVAQEEINGQKTAEMSLMDYAGIAAPYELASTGTLEVTNLMPTTTMAGINGYWAYLFVDDGNNSYPFSTLYFDLNQEIDGQLYRTIQVTGVDDMGLQYINTIAPTFAAGHQATVLHDMSDFTLYLPQNWTITSANANPWGVEYYLGAEPLGNGMNSYVMVVDPTLHSVDADLERLGQQWSDATLTTLSTSIDGQDATQAQFRFADETVIDIYYVEYADKLYSFWFHNSDALTTRFDIVNSFRFTS